MAHLIFYRRGQELMRVALDEARLLVGRGSEADVVVPDPSLRRTELAIEWDGQRHRVRRMGPDGLSAEAEPLEDGGALALGQFRAAYLETLPEGPAEASRSLNTSALSASRAAGRIERGPGEPAARSFRRDRVRPGGSPALESSDGLGSPRQGDSPRRATHAPGPRQYQRHVPFRAARL
jgi:hypothetical protein